MHCALFSDFSIQPLVRRTRAVTLVAPELGEEHDEEQRADCWDTDEHDQGHTPSFQARSSNFDGFFSALVLLDCWERNEGLKVR